MPAIWSRPAPPGSGSGEERWRGGFPLHYAAGAGTLSVVHFLVDRHGADPKIGCKLDESVTPLVFAARNQRLRVMEFPRGRRSNVDPEMLLWLLIEARTTSFARHEFGNAWAKYQADPEGWSGTMESINAETIAWALSEVGASP